MPISKLSQCVEETKKDLSDAKIFGPIVGHVGDGNFHVLLTCERKRECNSGGGELVVNWW